MTSPVTPAMANEPDPDENIFAAALQWDDPAERAAYLDEACAGRPDLRARVEALLRASSEAQTFLERPVGVPRPAPQAPAPTVKLGFSDLLPDPEGPGTRIGRYKLLQQIGEGGCGTVFMAEQEEPVRRRVALKVIKLGMDTKSVVARFEAERQALAMMDHPNIAKVLDAGATDSGRPFFVMELVRGIPITRYCDENKLETQQRLDLFIKVCQAIQHAHQKGIIHRDIKPSNILVTLHDGVPVPKVIDFGIAKATEGRLTNATLFTAFEQFIGTPAYMSPEQAEMSGLDIDTRSDIYALGVLLYELLTGATPFDAKELAQAGIDAMRRTIREREPMRPSTRLSTMQGDALAATAIAHGSDSNHFLQRIRGDLDWIVMRCLEKDRTRRYETANGLASDIQRHLRNEPVVARPPSVSYMLQKAIRRNRLAYGAGMAVALALVVGLCAAGLGWQQSRTERDKALKARHEAQTSAQQAVDAGLRAQAGEREARRAAAEARRMAYVADMAQAHQAALEGNLDRARRLLDRYRPKPGEEEIRGFEWRHIWALARSEEAGRLGGYGGFLQGLAMSPDGTRLASVTLQGVEIHTLRDRKLLTTLENAGGSPVQFSPDGLLLVTSRDNDLAVWSTRTWREVGVLRGAGSRFVFAGKGELIATLQGDHLALWSSQDFQKIGDLPGAIIPKGGFSCAMAASPDGNLIYVGEGPLIRIWDLNTRTESAPLQYPPGDSVTTLAVSREGLLAASHWHGQVTLWDPATGQRLHTFEDHIAWATGAEFSPDGASLATASADRNVFLYSTRTGKRLGGFKGHDGEIWALQYSADGRWLVSGSKYDDSVRLWHVPDRIQKSTTPGVSFALAFADAGAAVLAISNSGFSRTDLKSGQTQPWANWPAEFDPPDVNTRQYLNVRVGSVIISMDGTRAAGLQQGGRAIHVWNILPPHNKVTLNNPAGSIDSFWFTPDGNHLVVASPGWQTRVLDITHQTFRLLGDPGSKGPYGLCGSLDGTRLAQIGRTSGQVLDLASGRVILRLNDIPGVIGADLSPDGTVLALGTDLNVIHLWSVDQGQEMQRLRGHVAGVQGLAFSPDGRTLASCGDNRVKLWNLATGQEILTLGKFNNPPGAILFSRNGSGLVANLSDGQTPHWNAPSFEEIAAVEEPDGTHQPTVKARP